MDSVSSPPPFLSAKLHAVTPTVMTLYREPDLLLFLYEYTIYRYIYIYILYFLWIVASKIYQHDKTRAREMYTRLRFPFSQRTLLRCKFIQFQSHEYLHLSLTTLGIHLAGKIGKINNNDDARCGAALLSSFRKRRAAD